MDNVKRRPLTKSGKSSLDLITESCNHNVTVIEYHSHQLWGRFAKKLIDSILGRRQSEASADGENIAQVGVSWTKVSARKSEYIGFFEMPTLRNAGSETNHYNRFQLGIRQYPHPYPYWSIFAHQSESPSRLIVEKFWFSTSRRNLGRGSDSFVSTFR